MNYEYLRNNLKIEYVDCRKDNFNYYLAFIKHGVFDTDINREFLLKGFGKLDPTYLTNEQIIYYGSAEEEAKNNKLGVWKYGYLEFNNPDLIRVVNEEHIYNNNRLLRHKSEINSTLVLISIGFAVLGIDYFCQANDINDAIDVYDELNLETEELEKQYSRKFAFAIILSLVSISSLISAF